MLACFFVVIGLYFSRGFPFVGILFKGNHLFIIASMRGQCEDKTLSLSPVPNDIYRYELYFGYCPCR